MKLGIIGGSGLYNVDSIKKIDSIMVETPFGLASGQYLYGKIKETEIYFLPRHGQGHTISPSEINHRANIFGMKKLGVTHILSISAVGSLREELAPKDVVLIDQYLDRTKKSYKHTFFNNGIVAHIPFGDPICIEFSKMVFEQAKQAVSKLYNADKNPPKAVLGGTYVNMEGPAFSTKAESLLYKSWGMDIIGMTSLGEAKLAREAGICYCIAAMVTDYDCWHPEHGNVSIEMVINTMKSNINTAKVIIEKVANSFGSLERNCSCESALSNAIMTSPKCISNEIKNKLGPILKDSH
jgi:5'-methylthioadenosine phosphorylase